MKSATGSAAPQYRKLRIIAQDPSVLGRDGKILTTQVSVPAERLRPGPRGYRVHVIDYDATSEALYQPYQVPDQDEFAKVPSDKALLTNPNFHAQNVYAIVMRTLGAFEYALGRRVGWGFDSHQLQVAPHAFAVANAFYSRRDQALLFGYTGPRSRTVFTCLSHDVVAHETTHAVLDGLRGRYMEPSSIDQVAFHEGFADVIALLSVFALKDVVRALLKEGFEPKGDIAEIAAQLEASPLLGLGEQIGSEFDPIRKEALRRSVGLEPRKNILKDEDFQEPHRRGEVFVAAMMKSFVNVWASRIDKLGEISPGMRSPERVVEDGAKAAGHLQTIAIRALDYCPPTALTFGQYLRALLDADEDLQADDDMYHYRDVIEDQFALFGIKPAGVSWRVDNADLDYSRTRFESMRANPDEVFRFIWENRDELSITNDDAYIHVESVRPCVRQGSDGFILRETVAEYLLILNLTYNEVADAIGRERSTAAVDKRLRLFGGGTLIFDEYGQLKYHASNPLPDLSNAADRKTVAELWDFGAFETSGASAFAELHLTRATELPKLAKKEETEW